MNAPIPQPPSPYTAPPKDRAIVQHTLSVLVDNEPGVLARVVGLFSGRGYNIASLTVAEVAHADHLSRITIVTSGTLEDIEQITLQLDRLVPVHTVTDLTLQGDSVERELAMIKVAGRGENRQEALRLSEAFRGRVIDASDRQLHLRDDGRGLEDRSFRRSDAADRPRRGLAHRRRRDHPRPGQDALAGARDRIRSASRRETGSAR